MAEMTRRFALLLHAYVLMDNHYHLLVELREPNLSRAIALEEYESKPQERAFEPSAP